MIMTSMRRATKEGTGSEGDSARLICKDEFGTDCHRGAVVGSVGSSGIARRGVDLESVIAIDNGALRFEPLVRPGWGRCGVSYGPFSRAPGLALAVLVDNGHNLSQSYRLRSFVRQCVRWFRGSDLDGPHVRLWRWMGHRPRISLVSKMKRWYASREGGSPHVEVRESLAVGFFSSEAPGDPVRAGNGIVIHANRAFDNGELWARVGAGCASTCTSLQNLTMYYLVVLRERGAVYYAASVPGAHGVGGYPMMRPVAIDPANSDREVYAGVHQAVLGEIGFTMDTRVRGVGVAQLGAEFQTAHAADSLVGDGELGEAEAGGSWNGRGWVRSPEGARAVMDAAAVIDPGVPSSLVHAIVDATRGGAGLVFRQRDDSNRWEVRLGKDGCDLRVCEDGSWTTEASGKAVTDGACSIQVVDHGSEFTISIDGVMAFGRRFVEARLRDETGVGIVGSAEGVVRDFEAHPREVRIPEVLDLGSPWNEEGRTVRVRDDFSGVRADLAGRQTTVGAKEWRRDIGRGRFERVGDGSARVAADIGVPCPERTIYTVGWDEPGFADIDLEMTPPGTHRGETHRGRSGVVFWQDRLNYFMINLWLHDNLETASISTFFCIRGFDDLYDAIWTCTGPNRTTWGVPFRLRSVFDGNHFLVRINGEPVLQRMLTDVYPKQAALRINRVGLLSNWEWGTDTGTVFRDFVVRGR
jgi:hypothetical protein